VSKAITGVAIAKLVQDGRVPSFPDKGAPYGFNACVLDYRAEDLVLAMIFNTSAGGYPPAEKLAALFRAPSVARR